ncbi:hypothetical protein [Nonomuraea zeae]|uniref:hypothetical protein n=1 Tax=Nonomuraea zeae TaxID=1642303 RepID=UPI001982187A|nr:hypothetical protein [Nonomuraea zeae]
MTQTDDFVVDVTRIRAQVRPSHTDYQVPAGTNLRALPGADLWAERIVISTCQEIIRRLGDGDGDPTTRRLMASILEHEDEHADDLTDLLGV